jgi:hypothetical protein
MNDAAVPSLARLDKDAVEVTSFTDQKALLVKRWNASSQVLILSHFDPAPTELMLRVPRYVENTNKKGGKAPFLRTGTHAHET